MTTVCPILDIHVYLRVLKGDQREVSYGGKVSPLVHHVFLALTYVGTKDILSCTLPFPITLPSYLLCLSNSIKLIKYKKTAHCRNITTVLTTCQ